MTETVVGLPKEHGERRQSTFVFCDLMDSTGLSERLDPEDLRELLNEYVAICMGVFEGAGGRAIDQSGDGVAAQFGLPVTWENAAESAVRASLALPAALAPLRARSAAAYGENIAVRIGISTGLVVTDAVGPMPLRRMGPPFGEAPNVAARLQALAQPDSVVLSETTEQLVGGRFELEPLGPVTLKGLSRPVRVFRVVRERPQGDRFTTRIRFGMAPLVERAAELTRLTELAERARAGQGQVAFLLGEAGIGKSRLARELRVSNATAPFRRVVLHGSPHHQNVAYYPLIELFRRLRPVRAGQEARPQRPAAAAGENGLLAAVLDRLDEPGQDGAELRLEDAAARRRGMQSALLALLRAEAARRPVLLLVEDAHWIDPSTLEAIERALRIVDALPVLMVLTGRGEPRVAVPSTVALSRIVLERLSEDGIGRLATALAGESGLSSTLLQRIAAQSDGVPLFAEELTRAALETGRLGEAKATRVTGEVPASLHDPLMTRLDRLGEGKRVAQLAAALGRRFRADVLLAICGGVRDMQAALAQLVESEVLRPVRTELSVFAFKHALLRDVAYESMLRRDRRVIHGVIARTIEAQFPEIAKAEPDYLAQHCSHAGASEDAFRYWLQAARQSVVRSANAEAISQLKEALAELNGIAAGRDRDLKEIEVLTGLLGPVMAVLGYAHPEFASIGKQAFELCRKLECGPQVFPVLYSRWSHAWITGDAREAYRLAHEFLEEARQQRHDGSIVVGHRLCGSSLTSIGDPAGARDQLTQAIALYDAARDRPLAFLYGSDVRVVSLCHLAIACWLVGDLDRSAAHAADALAAAQALGHDNTLGYAVSYLCMLHVLERDGPRVEAMAGRMFVVAGERELTLWENVARGFLGWSAIQAGRVEEGVNALEHGLRIARAANTVSWMPMSLGWLAEGLGRLGEFRRGHACLDEAAAVMQGGGEAWWEPERLRIAGELLSREGRFDSSLKRFEEAATAARRLGESSLELRAIVSLARHLQAEDRLPAARSRLTAALEPFADTRTGVDQHDARLLLAAIGMRRATERASGALLGDAG